MSSKLSFALIFAIQLLGCGSAQAYVNYTYTSNTLEPWLGFENYQSLNNITISLDFSDDGASVLNWSASQSVIGEINKSDTEGLTGGLKPLLFLTTDSTGSVTSWYFSLYTSYDTDGSSGMYKQSLLSYNEQVVGEPLIPELPSAWDQVTLITPLPDRNFTYIASIFNNPGSWISNGSLPNLNYQTVTNVPEPQTYSMLFFGILFLSFIYNTKEREIT